MQQRQPRLGDTVDDYCPRERRITNHAIAAIADDQITHTRCTACEADHEYKQGKAPAPRKKPSEGALQKGGSAAARVVPHTAPEEEAAVLEALERVSVVIAEAVAEVPAEEPSRAAAGRDEDWPVHRRLIRATFPRPEGQPPEWKEPEFTNRQPQGGRHRRFGHGGQGEANGNRAAHPRRHGGQGGHGGQGNGNANGGHHGRPRHEGNPQGQGGQGQGPGNGGGGGRRRRRRR